MPSIVWANWPPPIVFYTKSKFKTGLSGVDNKNIKLVFIFKPLLTDILKISETRNIKKFWN